METFYVILSLMQFGVTVAILCSVQELVRRK
jgi:hypothetical protein